jgi:DNA-directed RNA polymerase subunit RPC12/RpoP
MPIFFYCPRCGREIRVRSIAAGRKGRCADCKAEIMVPDFNPIDPSRRPVTEPCADSAPDIRDGFMDNAEANQD